MKKGYKFKEPRSKEHNQKIGEGVKSKMTDERRKQYSDRMKLLWKLTKEIE